MPYQDIGSYGVIGDLHWLAWMVPSIGAAFPTSIHPAFSPPSWTTKRVLLSYRPAPRDPPAPDVLSRNKRAAHPLPDRGRDWRNYRLHDHGPPLVRARRPARNRAPGALRSRPDAFPYGMPARLRFRPRPPQAHPAPGVRDLHGAGNQADPQRNACAGPQVAAGSRAISL